MSSRLTRRENSLRGFLFGSILKRKGDDVRSTLFRPALPRATRRLPGDKGWRCPATTIVALLQEWKQVRIWRLCLYGAFASFLSDMKTAPVVLVKHKHSKRQTTFIKWTGILYINMPYEFIYFNAAPWVKNMKKCSLGFFLFSDDIWIIILYIIFFFKMASGRSFLQFCPWSCTQQKHEWDSLWKYNLWLSSRAPSQLKPENDKTQ